MIVIFLYIVTSESTLQDGRLDTLNSKIHPLVIILWQDREEEECVDLPPHRPFPDLNEILPGTMVADPHSIVLYSTVHWNTPLVEEESSRPCVGRYSLGNISLQIE